MQLRSDNRHYAMFTRFRQTSSRLQVSLAETRRVDGKVRHEHIASLGSVETPPTVQARIVFWRKLHERLAKLSNRVDAETQGKILGEVHARVPMVTADEQRALQLENAEAEARFWEHFQQTSEEWVDGHKGLAASAERAITNGRANVEKAAANAAVAKERIERIKRGENVEGGLGKPLSLEECHHIMREAGLTAGDIKHCVRVHRVSHAFGFEEMCKAIHEARDRAERNIVRKLHRRIVGGEP
jgi:hypothetical protein